MDFPRKEPPELQTNILNFQITDWYIPESDKNRDKQEEPDFYSIVIYGVTKEGYTISANLTEFEPYFYVKPPISWESYSDVKIHYELDKLYSQMISEERSDGYYKCTFKKINSDTKSVKENTYFKKIIPSHLTNHFVGLSIVKKKEFWGFTNNRDFNYIKVTVKSLMLYNNLKYYFQSMKDKGFKLYESNIDPFLRYIHERNIKPCGWISVSDFNINNSPDTRCNYNIETHFSNIHPYENNTIAPMLIASFDIECMSYSGDFPVAKKDYKKVAQEILNIAKAGYNITEDLILYWFRNIYFNDIIIDDNLKINKIYTKEAVTKHITEVYIKKLEENIIEILELCNKLYNIYNDSDDDQDENEDEMNIKKISFKEQNILELRLNEILSSILPELKGDKIIQIGTTVHKYGSDEIIYKNIITLKSCDSIPDTDVEICSTEKELILNWKNLIVRLNPDIITGYNIFGFDMEYIWIRAKENNIENNFALGLGRTITKKCTLIKQELSSSALGENILKYFDMDGTIIIDLFKVMQREHKLDSYKLDNVAKIFIGDKKDDLKPNEIFKKYKGTSQDRCIIAKYCIQDCALVNKLLHKLKILENNIGMGNVCLVPLSYLFKRGQGIKIFSLIAKQCMDKGYLIPDIRNLNKDIEDKIDSYEGAVVLEPKEGIYLNEPIVVFDYGSLYPSSMIARNLSHDCYIIDKKYQIEDPNIDYITVSYDLYEGIGDKKKKTGIKECVFAQYKDGRKGIIADILCMLLQERKNTRKKMEYKTINIKDGKIYSGILSDNDKEQSYNIIDIDTNNTYNISKKDVVSINDTFNNFEKDVFDSLQLAYKITANSLYGQIGAKTSPIYLKDIAACTTATGREMIMLAKNYVETNYNAEVIYGDSVMPYTPITYKTSNQIYLSTFENIEGYWHPYENFKLFDNDRIYKEQFTPNDIYIWTHKGWSKVIRLIRHKTTKKIYRITTGSSFVDVTEDHSLLNPDVTIIKPKDCYISKELLHSQPNIQTKKYTNISIEQAYIYGNFVSSGKCFKKHSYFSEEYIWEIENTNLNIINKCKTYLEKIEKIDFNIIIRNSKYILTPKQDQKNITLFYKKYITNCYIKSNKVIPNDILNSSKNILLEFKEGLDDSLGYIYIYNKYILDISNQVTIQSYILLFSLLNYNHYITNVGINKICIVLENNTVYDNNYNKIRNIKVIHESYNGYVYDIETEEGVFHGGVGSIILKNTDSIFCKFPLKDNNGNEIYGKDSLKYAIDIGKHVEKNIVSIMPKPQKLNYEKSLYPFIIFSKKRYVGNLYEFDDKSYKQKSMGIVLKRRDNAPIVKKIYGGIIDILLNRQDLHESIKYLHDELSDLVSGKTALSELVITKSLRSYYKDPTKIAHKVLADRMGERDPGNKPQANDRIPYIYIKVKDAKLQGDRIEHPDFILDKMLIPDYLHYITNQIMKPVLQLYSLCLDDLPNYDKTQEYWNHIENQLKIKPIYQDDVKRKNRMDSLKLIMVKELLFDKFIDMLSEPKQNKIRNKKSNEILDLNLLQKVSLIIEEKYEIVKELNAYIKVIKKKDKNNIESAAKIVEGKKNIWTYKSDQGKDKTIECKTIILKMIEYAKENKVKLHIKINNKPFIKTYKNLLYSYKEIIELTNNNENYMRSAEKMNDLGALCLLPDMINYEGLISQNNLFNLE